MRLRNPFGRKPKEFPSHLWTQCPNCGEMLFNKQLARNQSVCTNCGHHFKLGAKERLELLADARSFTETDADMVSSDPLGFVDSKTYPDRIAAAQAKTGHKDAVLTGTATISDIPVVLANARSPIARRSSSSRPREARACRRARSRSCSWRRRSRR